MKLITEYFPLSLNSQQINEAVNSTPGQPMIIKGVVIQRSNAKNRNGRTYPDEVLRREINDYNDTMVKHNRALGELDHSDSNVVNLKNVSHNIKKIYWDGNDVLGDIEILDGPEFPAGRIAAGLLRRKIPVGISSRGMGSVDEARDGSLTVNDDFKLLTFDLVSFESTQGANFSLNEGFSNKVKDSNRKIDDIIREIICEHSGVCECRY
jgi:hypothetical protein